MHRRRFLYNLSAVLASASIPLSCTPGKLKKKPNVLFIAIDDLRPQLACYGHKQMISPHLDKLAEQGAVFTRTYCQVPVCGASRASLLTGLRPTADRFTHAHTQAEKDAPEALAIQGHFKNNGYYTVSNGKIFQHVTDYADGWSEPPWRPNGEWWGWQAYVTEESFRIIRDLREKGVRAAGPFYAVEPEPGKYHALPGFGLVKSGPPVEKADVADNRYPDGMLADKVIDDILRLKHKNRPFFITAGFVKPHLPFAAPEKYWDLYDRETIDLADNPFRPKNAPGEALHNWNELRTYAGIPKSGPLDDTQAGELVHGYYACVSYIDAQIGRILDTLERQDLMHNTVIAVWGDHGWNLGEHGLWCKHCNFENALHSPLLIYAPGFRKNIKIDALTEFVDIYPSLCELCGIPVPAHLQGSSFTPLLENPQSAWKDAAFSRYQNSESIKTDRYRYTEYYDDSGACISAMLYDHKKDPHENVNVAGHPDYRETALVLAEKLGAHVRTVKTK